MKLKIWLLIFTTLIISSLISCEKEQVENIDIHKLTGVWKLDKFVDKNNDILIAPNIQISFLENYCLTVFTNYNYGQGEFSVNGNKVTVRNLALTDREYDLENDNNFINNLNGLYFINGDTLRILSDNDLNMVFHKTQIIDPYQCDLSTLLIDTINSNKYYSEDVLDAGHSSIYGKWFVYEVVGDWGEVAPVFDFLEFKRNGIYGRSEDFNLLEYGKIRIVDKFSNERLVLEYIPENITDVQGIYYTFEFFGLDTIVSSSCIGCYQLFYRVK